LSANPIQLSTRRLTSIALVSVLCAGAPAVLAEERPYSPFVGDSYPGDV
jgi:hypothetical protein